MDPSKDKEHLLALKGPVRLLIHSYNDPKQKLSPEKLRFLNSTKATLMRLTKPALMSSQPLINVPLLLQESVSNCDDSVQKSSDCSVSEELQYFALGSLLTLPQNFGNIFLGETFSCYVSIHNDSKQICRDIFIKADLQTSSQRLTLSGANPQTTNELAPEDSIDDVIHHEVKELGTHILACAVSYSTAGGEKMYFRKFFKFHVLKPLDVKTKFYNTESDDVYLEAQIQNITPGPIYLEKVSLEPSTKYTVRDLNSPTKSVSVSDCSGPTVTAIPTPQNLVFGEVNCMATNDIRQYLYRLTAKPELMSDIRQLKSNTLVGKLDIVWKTTMGERGRLQTSPLQRIAPGSGDIKVSVVNIPEAVAVGSSFTVDFRVTNCSERTMDLMLILQNSINSGVLWSGISNKQLGKLDPCTSTVLQLNIVAIRTGLLTMSGLRLMDMFLKRTYEHDEVAQIYVYTKDL